MQGHVRILAILHIVFGGLGILIGLITFLVLGGVAGIVGMTNDNPDALVAIPVLGTIGGLIFLFFLVLSLPEIIAGVGLLSYRPWARILTIVISIFQLLQFPFGTALGVYGLWVLLSVEGGAIFSRHPQYGR